MKVYVVQMESAYTNKEANLIKILDWINMGADAQADLIVFSEMCLTGYNCHQKYIDLAECIVPEPGPSVKQVMELARKRGVYVILGMPEINNTYLYNSAAVFGPEGLVGAAPELKILTAIIGIIEGMGGLIAPGEEFDSWHLLSREDAGYAQPGVVVISAHEILSWLGNEETQPIRPVVVPSHVTPPV